MNVVDLYTIQIINDEPQGFGLGAQRLTPNRMAEFMEETEENLTDLLPDGYRARIRRWDYPDEPIPGGKR